MHVRLVGNALLIKHRLGDPAGRSCGDSAAIQHDLDENLRDLRGCHTDAQGTLNTAADLSRAESPAAILLSEDDAERLKVWSWWRRIDSLLDRADEAFAQGQWEVVLDRSQKLLALASGGTYSKHSRTNLRERC